MFFRLRGLVPFFLFLLFIPLSSPAAKKTEYYYNEVFKEDGTIRPHYKTAYDEISRMSNAAAKRFIKEATKSMSGDTPIAPMPRIITEDEWQNLAKGVDQRRRAVQAFLKDHYSGKKTYLKRGKKGVIPEEIMKQIIGRSGEGTFEGYLTEKTPFRALYGADTIRAAALGKKKGAEELVLEDNFGVVGGTVGDTIPGRETYDALLPMLTEKIGALNDPHDFLTELIDRLQGKAEPKIGHHKGEGAIVMLSSPPYGDKEDVRLAQVLKERGIVLVTANTATRKKRGTSNKLVVRADGVYLQTTTKYGATLPERKVGMLYLNTEHAWADWKDPLVYERALLEEAKDYLDENGKKLKREKIDKNGKTITHRGGTKEKTKEVIRLALEPDPITQRVNVQKLEQAIKWAHQNDFAWFPSVVTHGSPVPGLVRAIVEGKVQTSYTPGMEFVGDKMFHSYMEDLIKYYLDEKPIIKNPRTERFFNAGGNGEILLNEKFIKEVMKQKDKWVIKIVDGRGGDGIYIGPKMKLPDWKALEKTIKQDPKRYVVQEYRHPSVLEDGHTERIVDIRMFSYMDENGLLVSRTPWARSTVMKGGDGKVNMSAGNGTETVVLVVPTPNCKDGLAGVGKEPTRKRR